MSEWFDEGTDCPRVLIRTVFIAGGALVSAHAGGAPSGGSRLLSSAAGLPADRYWAISDLAHRVVHITSATLGSTTQARRAPLTGRRRQFVAVSCPTHAIISR